MIWRRTLATLSALALLACGDDPSGQPAPDATTTDLGDVHDDAAEADVPQLDVAEDVAEDVPEDAEPDAPEPDVVEDADAAPEVVEDVTEPDAGPDVLDDADDDTDDAVDDTDDVLEDADEDADDTDDADDATDDTDDTGDADDADTEVFVPTGEGTCAEPILLGTGAIFFEGDTTEQTSSSDLVVPCGYIEDEDFSPDPDQPDAVHAFMPSQTGVYTLTLVGVPSLLYLTTTCPSAAGTCLAGIDTFELETFKAFLTAGETYYAVVDGWSDDESGAYLLEITGPAERVDGDTCADPLVIAEVPALLEGDTTNAVDDLKVGTCEDLDFSGAGVGDVVYTFTPETSGTYLIVLAGDATMVYVTTSCGADACLAAADFEVVDELEVALEAGTTYYVVVDGAFTYEVGEYVLSIALL